MAKCKCGATWVWDWNMDSYRYAEDGKFVKEKQLFESDGEKNLLGFHVTLFICKCGEVNSTLVGHDDIGVVLLNIKKWKRINWENKNQKF